MAEMMHKKAMAFISIVLGAIVILLVVYGLGNLGYQFAKEKIFGERGVLGRAPAEKVFVPYTGPPLTEEERKVMNSVNALRCALNSVALGEFRPNDPKVCPPPLEAVPQQMAQTPTGKAWAVVTGMTTTEPKQYDSSVVKCSGIAPVRVVAPAKKEDVIYELSKQIIDCKIKSDPFLKQDLRCAYVDYKRRGDDFSIDEDELVSYMKNNKAKFPGQEKVIDELLSKTNMAFQNAVEIQTSFNKGKIFRNQDMVFCIDFRHGNFHQYISINDCDIDATDTFSCSVKGFELPQDVGGGMAKLFLSAYGDPRWLVYYESFPPEAAEYWHKEWSDMFNLWTIATVTA
ncbi:MAG: hypothetical protein QXF14_00195, partial [Candidatus Woesearchaeota archaeon]